MTGINELKQLNQQLESLLANPQPGLFTWREALNKLLMQMTEYAGLGARKKNHELARAIYQLAKEHFFHPLYLSPKGVKKCFIQAVQQLLEKEKS